ncbi:2Fe-2S iron-sulfur cluster-binding protein [Desulforhopalus singaporensis]|uniref:NADH dehydrogenase subunit G n=1 Tax=Desulforhopalus singaporensis TaxID=91360 RepID=A0A1H0TSJ5_9BACT|nr:2Fe-2S iron-sulfur cluster-binding protein [Desulforhopalus singaporensis]SDP56903.1 NADH dehydrogenase subunit G [Desulforhopalus singaporensis]
MADKIKLFVNGEEVEVESGKNLVDAVSAVGIEIPHLCYHPALGADGNCRMCLVGLEEGGPPLVPACKTPAQEGMKVLLDAEHIRKIQHDVMEFELINHPIDCPVCDQAGECKLQDYYMGYDRKDSRMTVPQVTKSKKLDFGGGVVHDQERCIVCGRCVRFLRQITKTGELGIINRTDTARVNIFPGRPIDNRYGLNVVDLCPVGAMTSSDFRFKQRVWFLKKVPSVCHGCAKGCSITIDHNREKYQDDIIYRFRPRLNQQVNGYFMCNDGRLSYRRENEGRLTQFRLGKNERDMLDVITGCNKEIAHSRKTVVLVSPDLSLEQMVSVKALAEKLGATLSGFSDGYIKTGDGDDYLISDDKAANRKGLEILGIDSSRKSFEEAMADAELLINFNNDLSLSYDESGIRSLLGDTRTIACSTHDDELTGQAHFALAISSYSEYAGTVINCDNVLQHFTKAVTKNNELPDVCAIAAELGSPLQNAGQAYAELQRAIGALSEYQPADIPAEGLNLNDSEAANVTA